MKCLKTPSAKFTKKIAEKEIALWKKNKKFFKKKGSKLSVPLLMVWVLIHQINQTKVNIIN